MKHGEVRSDTELLQLHADNCGRMERLVPAGGATGQALTKASNTDYDFGWTTVSGGGTHAASHQNGGGDEISVAGLSGLLADPQTPATHAHAWADITGEPTTLAGFALDGEVSAAIAAAIAAIPKPFPIGSIFIGVVGTDPATLLGYGTWAAIGAGRVLVGQDTGDTDFDTLEETGGAKTKAISAHAGTAVADHASHTHTYTQVPNHVHPLATGTGTTGNFAQVIGTVDTSSGGTGGSPTQTALGTLSGNPSGGVATGTTNGPGATLTHAVTQPSNHTALNVVPPFYVVKMWKRTA